MADFRAGCHAILYFCARVLTVLVHAVPCLGERIVFAAPKVIPHRRQAKRRGMGLAMGEQNATVQSLVAENFYDCHRQSTLVQRVAGYSPQPTALLCVTTFCTFVREFSPL